MSRAILECSDFSEAYCLFLNKKPAASMNYLIGDAKGDEFACIESSSERFEIIRKERFIAHTNVFRGGSCARQRKITDLLNGEISRSHKLSPEAIQSALKRVEFHLSYRGDIETVHMLLLNISQKEMYLSEGAMESAFMKYSFS